MIPDPACISALISIDITASDSPFHFGNSRRIPFDDVSVQQDALFLDRLLFDDAE